MSVYVVIQPAAGYGAEVVSPSPGVRQLAAGGDGVALLLQVPARVGGLADTARFARGLAAAASEFSEWCEAQDMARSDESLLPYYWQGISPEAESVENPFADNRHGRRDPSGESA